MRFPTTGRLAGVDHGSKRIGLAITDPDRILASPLGTYTRTTTERDAAYFVALTAREQISGFVVGLPTLPSGDEGTEAARCRAFGAWLATTTDRPVTFWDERYTSTAATDLLLAAGLTGHRRKARVDGLAAQLILESFLSAPEPNE